MQNTVEFLKLENKKLKNQFAVSEKKAQTLKLENKGIRAQFATFKKHTVVLKSENKKLQDQFSAVEKITQVLKLENKNLSHQVAHYKQDSQNLFEQLRLLKNSLYGKSSERVEDIPEQGSLFNEIEEEALKDPESKKITVTYTRESGKRKRVPFPEDLMRKIEINDLPEDKKVCPTHGDLLKEIKPDIKSFLVTKPAEMWIREVHTKRYTCSCCDRPPVQEKSKSIIQGSIATEETISFLIFSKYFQHLPLYRLEDLYRLYDIKLSRSVMASWLINISTRLTPLYNVLEERMLESGYVVIDETHVQVLKEFGRKATTKSSMWVRASEALKIALFDYDISKGSPAVNRLLKGYTGALQADEHSCYNQIEKDVSLRLGCMMHARRRFIKAKEVDAKSSLALEGVAFFKKLYELEEIYKNLTYEERYKARLRDHVPLLEKYKAWLLEYRVLSA